jgi:hypothetical protein
MKAICSESGMIGYKLYPYKQTNILLAILFPNNYGSEEIAQFMIERILDYMFYALLMHIGYVDLFNHKSMQEIDSLKKMIEVRKIFNYF